jgi:uncharacterized protein
MSVDVPRHISRMLLGLGFGLAVSMSVSWPVHAISFDRKSAKHPNERLICQSTELSELDERMVAVFE